MPDRSYAEAIYRRFIRIHPEHSDWLAAVSSAARTPLLAAWWQSPEAERHTLADDLDRLADAEPEVAGALRAHAQQLRTKGSQAN